MADRLVEWVAGESRLGKEAAQMGYVMSTIRDCGYNVRARDHLVGRRLQVCRGSQPGDSERPDDDDYVPDSRWWHDLVRKVESDGYRMRRATCL